MSAICSLELNPDPLHAIRCRAKGAQPNVAKGRFRRSDAEPLADAFDQFLTPLRWLYRFSASEDCIRNLVFGLVWKVMLDGGLKVVVLVRLARKEPAVDMP